MKARGAKKKRRRYKYFTKFIVIYKLMKFGGIGNTLDRFRWQIGVDLGSGNTRIWVKDKGIVVDEPTLIARVRRKRQDSGEILAVGGRAREMWQKEPRQIEVVAPIRNGIIFDLRATERLVEHFLKLVFDIPSRWPKFLKPRVVAGVPLDSSELERRAIRAVFRGAGAGEVVLAEGVVLAAVGLGLPMVDGGGLLVVDVGGGKAEVGVVSMGGVVVGRGIKTAGNDFDAAIINFVKMKYGILMGLGTARRVKEEVKEMGIIRGRDLETGLPKTVKVLPGEIEEAVSLEGMKIVKLVTEVLDETPPELMGDIVKRGMVMVGGGAKLSFLASILAAETKIGVTVAENPEHRVIKGIGELIDKPERKAWVRLVSGTRKR